MNFLKASRLMDRLIKAASARNLDIVAALEAGDDAQLVAILDSAPASAAATDEQIAEGVSAALAAVGVQVSEGQTPTAALAALVAEAKIGRELSASIKAAGLEIGDASEAAIKAGIQKLVTAESVKKISAAGVKELASEAPTAGGQKPAPAESNFTGLDRAIAAHKAATQSK